MSRRGRVDPRCSEREITDFRSPRSTWWEWIRDLAEDVTSSTLPLAFSACDAVAEMMWTEFHQHVQVYVKRGLHLRNLSGRERTLWLRLYLWILLLQWRLSRIDQAYPRLCTGSRTVRQVRPWCSMWWIGSGWSGRIVKPHAVSGYRSKKSS